MYNYISQRTYVSTDVKNNIIYGLFTKNAIEHLTNSVIELLPDTTSITTRIRSWPLDVIKLGTNASNTTFNISSPIALWVNFIYYVVTDDNSTISMKISKISLTVTYNNIDLVL